MAVNDSERARQWVVILYFLNRGSLPDPVGRFCGAVELVWLRCICGFVGASFTCRERSFAIGHINWSTLTPQTLARETAQALRIRQLVRQLAAPGKRHRHALVSPVVVIYEIIQARAVLMSLAVAVHSVAENGHSCLRLAINHRYVCTQTRRRSACAKLEQL